MAALYEGAAWCRAAVTSVTGDVINVWYVDYGNEGTCDVTNVRPLDNALYALPNFAAHMRVVGFENGCSEEAKRSFAELVAEHEEVLLVRFVEMTDADHVRVELNGEMADKMAPLARTGADDASPVGTMPAPAVAEPLVEAPTIPTETLAAESEVEVAADAAEVLSVRSLKCVLDEHEADARFDVKVETTDDPSQFTVIVLDARITDVDEMMALTYQMDEAQPAYR